jgi:hypothetical protein
MIMAERGELLSSGPGGELPSCACVPASALPLLARLRAHPGIRVLKASGVAAASQPKPEAPARDALPLAGASGLGWLGSADLPPPTDSHVWIRWPASDEEVFRVVSVILGAECFVERGGRWYRPGAHLPSFQVPFPAEAGASRDQVETISLPGLIGPAPLSALAPPRIREWQPVQLALVRDDHIRRATALLCSLSLLESWTSGATSRQLEGLQAAWNGSRVLVVGEALPPLTGEGVLRYTGRSVLVPLGFRLDPPLFGEGPALREAFRLGEHEFALLEQPGVGRIADPSHPDGLQVDVLPRSALAPLTRAGVRLARRESRP